jgi:hypothetical protein
MNKPAIWLDSLHNFPVTVRQAFDLESIASSIKTKINRSD